MQHVGWNQGGQIEEEESKVSPLSSEPERLVSPPVYQTVCEQQKALQKR